MKRGEGEKKREEGERREEEVRMKRGKTRDFNPRGGEERGELGEAQDI